MVMSRLYSEVNYGTYKQVFWVYSSLTVVFTLGLPRAFGYFLPKVSLEEGQDLTDKITRLFFILGATFSILLFSLSDLISKALDNPDLSLGLKVFSPVPFFLIPTIGIDSIYATYKKTEISAFYNVGSKAILAICLIASSILYSQSYIYAIIAFNIASFISFVFALYLKRKPYKGIKSKKTSITIKEILFFSLPIMGANIINIIINSTDQFFISRYFGVTEFAQFSNGAMELPFIGMIVGACSVVLLPVYSRLRANNQSIHECRNDIIGLWGNVIVKTIKLIYPLVIFCMFFSHEIMVLLYGDKYVQSGLFFRIMLINNFFAVISTYPLILALNKVRQYMYIYAINAIILILLELMSVYLFNNVYIICCISVFCLALRNILFINVIAGELQVGFSKLIPWRVLLLVGLSAVLSCLIARVGFNLFILPLLIRVSIALAIASILYFAIALCLGLDYLSILKPLFYRKLNKHD